MSEESRSPEREINEAELANVSGGVALTAGSTETEVLAFLCNHCPGSGIKKSLCSGSAGQVAKYLEKHRRSINGPRECPFYQG